MGVLLTWQVVSIGVRWRPSLTAAIVTQLVTRTLACRGGEWLLRRSFHAGGRTAVFLVGASFLVFWVLPSVRGFCPVLARGWHDQLGRSEDSQMPDVLLCICRSSA